MLLEVRVDTVVAELRCGQRNRFIEWVQFGSSFQRRSQQRSRDRNARRRGCRHKRWYRTFLRQLREAFVKHFVVWVLRERPVQHLASRVDLGVGDICVDITDSGCNFFGHRFRLRRLDIFPGGCHAAVRRKRRSNANRCKRWRVLSSFARNLNAQLGIARLVRVAFVILVEF